VHGGAIIVWSCGKPRYDVIEIPVEGVTLGRFELDENDNGLRGDHLRIELTQQGYYKVVDLGGSNGVFVFTTRVTGAYMGPAPLIVLASRTVLVLVKDIRPFRGVSLSQRGDLTVAGTSAELCRAVDAAALAEQNITLDGTFWVGRELGRSYAERIGGAHIFIDARIAGRIDEMLSATRYRTVILALTRPLAEHEVAGVATWLETDTRFVTVVKPQAVSFVGMPPDVRTRLTEHHLQIPRMRLDELAPTIHEIIQERYPGTHISESVIVHVLYQAFSRDEDDVLREFTTMVERWHPQSQFRSRDLKWAYPDPTGNYCIVGRSRP